MNYDMFRDLYYMEFHAKTYTEILNLHQYQDKVTKEICIKAEVYDPEDATLKTIRAPRGEFKFYKKSRGEDECWKKRIVSKNQD